MRKASKKKSEIVETLAEVFRTHGFHGASLTKLTEGAGLERASLYHYFPKGKADMAEAVLLQALERLDASVLSPLREEQPPEKRIRNMLLALDHFYLGGNQLCFLTIFSLNEVSSRVNETMLTSLTSWLRLLQKTLQDLEVDRPKESAQRALATIQGGLVLSHAMGDASVFTNCLKLLKTEWLSK